MQTFSSHICTTAWIVLSNNFGTPPLYFQMFIFLAILLPCSTAHHVLFLHNFGTKSHLYQLFPLVEELLERYGFTAIFKNGIDINIVLLYSSNGHDYLYYCKTIFCQKLGQDFETKWNVAKVFNEMFKCVLFNAMFIVNSSILRGNTVTGVFYGSAGLKHPNYTEVTFNQCHFTRPQAGSRIFNPGNSGTGFCNILGSRDFSGRD